MINTGLTRKALKYNHSLWLGFHSIIIVRTSGLQKNVVIETLTTIMNKCKFQVVQVFALSE